MRQGVPSFEWSCCTSSRGLYPVECVGAIIHLMSISSASGRPRSTFETVACRWRRSNCARSVMDSISATGRNNVPPLQNVPFAEITIDTMKRSVFGSRMLRWIPTINSPRPQVMDIHPCLFPPRMEIRHVKCARNAIRTMQMSVRGDETRLQETGTVEVAVEEMGKNQTITITQPVVIVANGVGWSCRSVRPLPFVTSVNSPMLDLH